MGFWCMPVTTPGLGNPFFLHQEREIRNSARKGEASLIIFLLFSKVTEISPNLISLFSLKAVAWGTLPILICLFFSLSFHCSYFLYWIIVCPCWGEENKTEGKTKWVKAPGPSGLVVLCETGTRELLVSAAGATGHGQAHQCILTLFGLSQSSGLLTMVARGGMAHISRNWTGNQLWRINWGLVTIYNPMIRRNQASRGRKVI